MEISVDKLLQIIGSQQVELMMLRVELETLKRGAQVTNGATPDMKIHQPPSSSPPVN